MGGKTNRGTFGGLLLALVLPACQEIIPIHLQASKVPPTVSTSGWVGPAAVDLGDVGNPSSASFYSTANGGVVTNVSQSFSDFRVVASPDGASAQLVAGLFNGSRFRPLGRKYTVSGGWAATGASTYLDGASTGSYTQVAAAANGSAIQAVFGAASSLNTDAAGGTYFNGTDLWGGFTQSIAASMPVITFQTAPRPTQAMNGRGSSLAWSPDGYAYYAYTDQISGEAVLLRYNGFTHWETSLTNYGPNVYLGTAVSQLELQGDGLGVTALTLNTADNHLRASWSLDQYFNTEAIIGAAPANTAPITTYANNPAPPRILDTASTAYPYAVAPAAGTVQTFGSATDGQGTVLAVFLQNDPALAVNPIITTPFIYNNSVRVYATVRGADGQWVGPTRIDDALNAATTTAYQNSRLTALVPPASEPAGGLDYFTPAVAYVGGGRFLAAFAMTDLATLTSSLYVRGYQVGQGWDPTPVALDSQTFLSSTVENFRYVNDLAISANGRGDAMLVAHVAVSASASATSVIQRSHALKAFPYHAGAWQTAYTLSGSTCSAVPAQAWVFPASYYCWISKPAVATLASGASVIVYAAPTASSSAAAPQLRLQAMEYVP